jgi:hypothetical protein
VTETAAGVVRRENRSGPDPGARPIPTAPPAAAAIAAARLLKVVDPDTAITIIRDFISNVPVTHYYSWRLPPGLPPRWAQSHLELFASKVIPAFR